MPVSHVNQLPTELLARIFYLGVAAAGELEYSEERCGSKLPKFAVLCSHVCSHWRTVSIASPELWTYIGFDKRQDSIDVAAELLRRSKAARIVVSVYYVRKRIGRSDKDFDLCPKSENVVRSLPWNRIQTLAIECERLDIMELWLDSLGPCGTLCLDQLEELSLRFFPEYGEVLTPHFQMRPAPKLLDVDVWGITLHEDVLTSLKHLTDFQLGCFKGVSLPIESLARLLRSSPQLCHLALWDTISILGAPTCQSVELNSLKSLELRMSPAVLEAIMEVLKFSDLIMLTLDIYDEVDEDLTSSVIESLSQAEMRYRFATLEKFRLLNLECSAEILVGFLSTLTSVTWAQINFRGVDQSIFDYVQTALSDLALNEESVFARSALCMLPMLRTLKLSGIEEYDLEQFIALRNATSRQGVTVSPVHRGQKIERLEIEQRYLPSEGTLAWLGSLGIEVDTYIDSGNEDESESEDVYGTSSGASEDGDNAGSDLSELTSASGSD